MRLFRVLFHAFGWMYIVLLIMDILIYLINRYSLQLNGGDLESSEDHLSTSSACSDLDFQNECPISDDETTEDECIDVQGDDPFEDPESFVKPLSPTSSSDESDLGDSIQGDMVVRAVSNLNFQQESYFDSPSPGPRRYAISVQ